MHVDGFRFDLAPVLGRDPNDFDSGASFFDIIRQDPVFAKASTKFIAEPWDLGNNGYQLGAFPEGWSEWNDRFRDTLRGFWLTWNRTLRTRTADCWFERYLFPRWEKCDRERESCDCTRRVHT